MKLVAFRSSTRVSSIGEVLEMFTKYCPAIRLSIGIEREGVATGCGGSLPEGRGEEVRDRCH